MNLADIAVMAAGVMLGTAISAARRQAGLICIGIALADSARLTPALQVHSDPGSGR